MTYDAIHYWVRKHYGKASKCEFCGDESKGKYHWSNISGNYLLDKKDWQQLCVSCHKNYDYKQRALRGLPLKITKTHCKRGHEFTEENIRIRKVGKYSWRVCRSCERFYYNNLKIKEGII